MILLVFTFLLLLAVSLAVVLVYTRPTAGDKAVRVRLADIRNPRRTLDNDTGNDEFDEKEEGTLSERLGAYLQRYPITTRLRVLLMHAQSSMTVGTFALFSIATGALFAAIASLFLPVIPLELAAACCGHIIPLLWLKWQRNRRLHQFRQKLPDAIDLMARALRAGHSIQQALELIAEQSQEPIRGEFAQVHQEQKFGIPFRDALLQMNERIDCQDLRFVITAILVQKETGGDLIDILDRTTAVIRDRVRVEGEIKVYTAQGRLTGWILSLLPVIMLILISVASPGYSTVLFHDPIGQKLLGLGCVMIAIGCFIIRRIVDVEI